MKPTQPSCIGSWRRQSPRRNGLRCIVSLPTSKTAMSRCGNGFWRGTGKRVGAPPRSRRARMMAQLGRWLGPNFLLPLLLEEEGREVKGYLELHRESSGGAADTALTLARESKEHADRLAGLSGRGAEPWHKTGARGILRNVVYGFNDGLTANFGLLAGMFGAQESMATAGHAAVVAGLAGMVADALSMGASGYLAAK